MAHPVVHFEIRSADADATRRFFGDLFGWTFAPAGMPGLHVRRHRRGSAAPRWHRPLQGGSSMVTVYVGVEDVAATLEAAERLGGTIVQPAS